MRFADSETQRLLRDTARSYLAARFPWERLYQLEQPGERLSPADLSGLAEQGWFGLLVPESAGGSGLSLLEAATVIEEFGYAAVPAPVIAAAVAAYLLSNTRGDANDQLPSLASGARIYTVADSARRHAPPTLAVAGDRVEGRLPMVPFATIAGVAIAPATVDGEPALVALPLANARIEPLELLDRPLDADVYVEALPRDRCLVLATGAPAHELHERCDALTTAFGLIELAGVMQRIVEMTAHYISNRVQFGQPIAKFQAARHRAAELLSQAETTRWAAYHALGRFQDDSADTNEVWLAKHWAIRAADRVFQVSHLLHGGVGVNMEYPLHLLTQRMAALAARAGTMDEMVDRTVEGLALGEAQ